VILALPFTSLGAQRLTERRPGTVPPAVDSVLARGIATDFAVFFATVGDAKGDAVFTRSAYESGVRMEQTLESRWIPAGLQVWVAFPEGVDHWHRYTIAEHGGRVFRLGGFQSPELVALDRFLGRDSAGLQHRAAVLAALADPNGAERFVVSDTATTSLGDAGTIVTLRTAAWEPNSYAAHWEGFRYAFMFSANGELVEWYRQELTEVKAPPSSAR